MRYLFMSGVIVCSLSGCFEVTSPITNQYAINTYQSPKPLARRVASTIHVTVPEAVTSLENTQMLYSKYPYEEKPFAHNAWHSAPPEMIYPLIVESLGKSRAFRVISVGTQAENDQYQLHTHLFKLIQNFNRHPSREQFVASASLVDSATNDVIASKLFKYSVPCPADTPYGGVVAANQIAARFTNDLTRFTIQHLRSKRHHRHRHKPYVSPIESTPSEPATPTLPSPPTTPEKPTPTKSEKSSQAQR